MAGGIKSRILDLAVRITLSVGRNVARASSVSRRLGLAFFASYNRPNQGSDP